MEIRLFRKRIKSFAVFIHLFSFAVSFISRGFNKKRAKEDYSRVLLIRTDFLGDIVMNTSLVAAIRKTFANAKITAVASRGCAEIMRNDPNIDDVIAIDINDRFAGRKDLVLELLKVRFDLILDLTPRWWSVILGFLKSPTARRYDRDAFALVDKVKRNYLILKGHYEREFKREHDVIRALKVIEDFYDISNVPDIYFPLPNDADEIFSRFAGKYELSSKGYFVVCPGSQWEVRRWAVNKFAEAAMKIADKYQLEIVATGVPSELEICNQFQKLTHGKSKNLAGRLSLEEFVILVYNSRLLMGNDSGPAHVAAGLKTPVVAVMGTADVDVFKPWGTDVRICYREVLCGPCYSGSCYMPKNICLQPVTVDEVIAAADELLAGKGAD